MATDETWAVRTAFLMLAACGPSGSPPALGDLGNQVVAVNQELRFAVLGSDPDGDPLTYAFTADLPAIHERAHFDAGPSGAGEFRWTPLAADQGLWPFGLAVSDGVHTTSQTIQIDVRAAVGEAPSFIHPAGMGTTLDLSQAACVDVALEVVDADSLEVTLGQAEPTLAGASLTATGGTTATWHFCPSPMEVAASDHYGVTFTADDGDNPVTQHPYLIVLEGAP